MKAINEQKREQAATLRANGYTYAQIAKKLKVSVPTVGVWTRSRGTNPQSRPVKVTKTSPKKPNGRSLQALSDSLRHLADILVGG